MPQDETQFFFILSVAGVLIAFSSSCNWQVYDEVLPGFPTLPHKILEKKNGVLWGKHVVSKTLIKTAALQTKIYISRFSLKAF